MVGETGAFCDFVLVEERAVVAALVDGGEAVGGDRGEEEVLFSGG